ncbi:hypothetical protein TI04_05605 [Achromatium sp. WMS2]|nr:hypothetical protein TI04_05605 [Achromatium sp. WMS2]
MLWSKTGLMPGAPVLIDDFMDKNFYQRCQIQSLFGVDEKSFVGCLLTRPLHTPVLLTKKWIGLFDHFRFTPYLELYTPTWLTWLSRIYDSISWIGFGLCFFYAYLLLSTKNIFGTKIQDALIAPIAGIGYVSVILAQHTIVHTEDRYGFPLIPLCTVAFVVYIEDTVKNYKHKNLSYKKLAIFLGYCLAMLVIFITQIVTWDVVASIN